MCSAAQLERSKVLQYFRPQVFFKKNEKEPRTCMQTRFLSLASGADIPKNPCKSVSALFLGSRRRTRRVLMTLVPACQDRGGGAQSPLPSSSSSSPPFSTHEVPKLPLLLLSSLFSIFPVPFWSVVTRLLPPPKKKPPLTAISQSWLLKTASAMKRSSCLYTVASRCLSQLERQGKLSTILQFSHHAMCHDFSCW